MIEELKALLLARDESFWPRLARRSQAVEGFNDLIFLSTLRKKAEKSGLTKPGAAERDPLRLAIVGAGTLYPLSELIEHMLVISGFEVEVMLGDYNNCRAEILETSSSLYDFKPNVIVLVPAEESGRYTGLLTDAEAGPAAEVQRVSKELLELCSIANERTKAEVVLCNYVVPPYFDLGAYRAKRLGSDWNFRKAVNLSLGTKAPAYVHVCDLEFLSYRLGGLLAREEKSWFESKQLYSPALQVGVANEVAHLIRSLKSAPKKVLVLDLDNTLWGGVVGDDEIEGIELGDTSPRGKRSRLFKLW
jgi:predicted enzyme involved in methoxymalonyl-ACP biosynthesis